MVKTKQNKSRVGRLGVLLIMAVTSFVVCKEGDNDSSSIDTEVVRSIESGMEEMSEGLAGINESSGQNLAQAPDSWLKRLIRDMYEQTVTKAHATGSGAECVSSELDNDFGTAGVSGILGSRTFTECSRRFITIDGTVEFEFADLEDGEPAAGTVISRAPDLTRTHSERSGRMEVTGLYSETLGDTSIPVAQKLTFEDDFDWDAKTGDTTFTSNVRRDYYLEEELKRSVTVISDVTITHDGGETRTLNGTIVVENTTKGFTSTFTYSNVQWDVEECYPKSGTVSFEGDRGEGSITFDADNIGDVEVNFEATAVSESTQALEPRPKRRRGFRRRTIRLAGCRNS